jgi:hypothetical protein
MTGLDQATQERQGDLDQEQSALDLEQTAGERQQLANDDQQARIDADQTAVDGDRRDERSDEVAARLLDVRQSKLDRAPARTQAPARRRPCLAAIGAMGIDQGR